MIYYWSALGNSHEFQKRILINNDKEWSVSDPTRQEKIIFWYQYNKSIIFFYSITNGKCIRDESRYTAPICYELLNYITSSFNGMENQHLGMIWKWFYLCFLSFLFDGPPMPSPCSPSSPPPPTDVVSAPLPWHTGQWWCGGHSGPPTVPAYHNGGTVGRGGRPPPGLPHTPLRACAINVLWAPYLLPPSTYTPQWGSPEVPSRSVKTPNTSVNHLLGGGVLPLIPPYHAHVNTMLRLMVDRRQPCRQVFTPVRTLDPYPLPGTLGDYLPCHLPLVRCFWLYPHHAEGVADHP